MIGSSILLLNITVVCRHSDLFISQCPFRHSSNFNKQHNIATSYHCCQTNCTNNSHLQGFFPMSFKQRCVSKCFCNIMHCSNLIIIPLMRIPSWFSKIFHYLPWPCVWSIIPTSRCWSLRSWMTPLDGRMSLATFLPGLPIKNSWITLALQKTLHSVPYSNSTYITFTSLQIHHDTYNLWAKSSYHTPSYFIPNI